MPNVRVRTFDVDTGGCEITGYEVLETGSDTALADWTTSLNSNGNWLTVSIPESAKHVVDNYTFRLKITA